MRGLPLQALSTGALVLWATEWSGERTLTRADAFAHHELVARLCDGTACLPVRFGTWLADEAAARRSLDAGGPGFVAALERVGQRQEVALTLLWREAPTVAGRGRAPAPPGGGGSGTGRAFLVSRRDAQHASDERREAAEALAGRLADELATDRADVRHESCPSAEVAVSMSLLAPRGGADALKARAVAAVADLALVRGVVSGPWPPYSFSGDLAGSLGSVGSVGSADGGRAGGS